MLVILGLVDQPVDQVEDKPDDVLRGLLVGRNGRDAVFERGETVKAQDIHVLARDPPRVVQRAENGGHHNVHPAADGSRLRVRPEMGEDGAVRLVKLIVRFEESGEIFFKAVLRKRRAVRPVAQTVHARIDIGGNDRADIPVTLADQALHLRVGRRELADLNA